MRQVGGGDRPGADEQVAQLARDLEQLGEAEDVGAPAGVTGSVHADRGLRRDAVRPVAREVVEHAQLELGRAGRRGGDSGRTHVERGQAQHGEVRLRTRLAAWPAVAGADAHPRGRAEHSRRPRFERGLQPRSQLRLVGRPAFGRRPLAPAAAPGETPILRGSM
jgi:hypothetical protein